MSVDDENQSIEYKKWVHELNREDAKRAHDRFDKFTDFVNDAAIKSSEIALRAAILINGGAAVSILAFIGGIVSKEKFDPHDSLIRFSDVSNSLVLFGLGVFSAALGIGFSYITHYATAGHAASFKHKFEYPYIEKGKSTILWSRFKALIHFFALMAGAASLFLFGADIDKV